MMQMEVLVFLNQLVTDFVGGQLEIQNQEEGYLFRGEIESVIAEGGELAVRFRWLAKGEGYPPLPKRWIKAEDRFLDWGVSLEVCEISDDIAQGRIRVFCFATGELAVFFPPNGSKLDPAKVEGLQLQ